MKAVSILLPLASVIVVAMLFLPGYASDYQGTTQSASSQYDVKYITLALGSSQYQPIVTDDLQYHTETTITKQGRTLEYVLHPTDTITVSSQSKSVCLVAAFDLTLTASGDMPEYDLLITGTGTVSSSYTYYLGWRIGSGDMVTTAFEGTDITSTGLTIEDLQAASLTVNIYVDAAPMEDVPEKIFNDVALTFTAQADETAQGGSP